MLLDAIEIRKKFDTSFEIDLLILHLYLIIYPDKYNDYANYWVKKIKKENPINIYWYKQANINIYKIFKKHFEKNFTLKEQTTFIEKVNKKVTNKLKI